MKKKTVQTGKPEAKKTLLYNVAEILPWVWSLWQETFLPIQAGEILSEQRQLKAQTSWRKHLLRLSHKVLNRKQNAYD